MDSETSISPSISLNLSMGIWEDFDHVFSDFGVGKLVQCIQIIGYEWDVPGNKYQ